MIVYGKYNADCESVTIAKCDCDENLKYRG